jgi:branched-chain amino acid transport system permease protein
MKLYHLRQPINLGLVAGLITLVIGLIGMLELFEKRIILTGLPAIKELSLGTVLLFLSPLVAGNWVARKAASEKRSIGQGLLEALITGIISAVPILLFLALMTVWKDIRDVFENANPALVKIFTFGEGVHTLAILEMVVTFAVASIIGALLVLLPKQYVSPFSAGFAAVFVIGVLSDLLSQVFKYWTKVEWLETSFIGQYLVEGFLLKVLLKGGTLTLTGAIIIFVLVAGYNFISQIRKTTSGQSKVSKQLTTQQMLSWGISGLLLLIAPWIAGPYLSDVMVSIGLYILMGLGLNIAVGLAGLLDLGYVATFAIGGYVVALFTSTSNLGISDLNFWMVVPLAIVSAMIAGFFLALPVLRMRGDYLAITTLGFGEIIRLLALSDWLKPYIGGAQGILAIPKPTLLGFEFSGPEEIYYIVLVGCLVMLFISMRITNSRTGRQYMALREDEDVAKAMGIDTTRTKLLAFTISAASGGLAGAIFAAKVGSTFPHSFNLLVSINVLALIIVGGLGSIPGVVVGAIALVGLPELLREFSEYRLLMYGIVLIVMMLVRPEGLWPAETTKREMHGEKSSAN